MKLKAVGESNTNSGGKSQSQTSLFIETGDPDGTLA
jgi:hypothetical protein